MSRTRRKTLHEIRHGAYSHRSTYAFYSIDGLRVVKNEGIVSALTSCRSGVGGPVHNAATQLWDAVTQSSTWAAHSSNTPRHIHHSSANTPHDGYSSWRLADPQRYRVDMTDRRDLSKVQPFPWLVMLPLNLCLPAPSFSNAIFHSSNLMI